MTHLVNLMLFLPLPLLNDPSRASMMKLESIIESSPMVSSLAVSKANNRKGQR